MRTWPPRDRKDVSRSDPVDLPNDVFEQPERSLLGEALRKPVGMGAALIFVCSGLVFAVNHLFLNMERFDDFALAGLFLGGGVLVSVLLRSGDTSSPMRKRAKSSRPAPAREVELVLDDEIDFELPEAELGVHSGLAEAPAPTKPRLKVASSAAKAADVKRPASLSPVQAVEDDEISSLQKALVHYVDAGDLHGQGEVLRRLGHTAKSRGHLRESQGFYMKSRDCFQKIGDHYAEAAVLLDLGQVLESLDEHDAASAAYRDANRSLLDVAMNSGDRYNDVQANAAD